MNREEELLQIIKELKKEKKNWKSKIHYLNNKEKRKAQQANYEKSEKRQAYLKKNKEQRSLSLKDWRSTDCGIKKSKYYRWTLRGLKTNNFDEIYKRYNETKNCDFCKVVLTIDKKNKNTTKCLDHSHITGEFRNILCMLCNTRRGENNL